MSNEWERIDRLERRVDYLIRYLGINQANIIDGVFPEGTDLPAPSGDPAGGLQLPEQFYAALRKNKLIDAIKIYREVTGAGLGEAKAAVESIARGQ